MLKRQHVCCTNVGLSVVRSLAVLPRVQTHTESPGLQAVENLHGGGPTWGLLQMPFDDSGPGDIAIQFSKQYFALMQVRTLLHALVTNCV